MNKVIKLRLETRRNLGLLCFVVGCISAFIRVDFEIRFTVSFLSFVGACVLYFFSIYKFVFKNRIIKIEAGEKKEDIHYQQFSSVVLNSSKDLSLLNSAGDCVFAVSLKGVSQKQINQLLMNFEELGKTIKYNGKLNKTMVLKFKLSIGRKILRSVCCFFFMLLLIMLLALDPIEGFLVLLFGLPIFGRGAFFMPHDKFTLSPDSFIFHSEGTTKQVNLSDVSKALLSNEKLLLLYDTTNQNEVSYTFNLKKLKNKNIQILLNYLQTNVPVYVEEEIQKREKFVLYEQPADININTVVSTETQNNVQQSSNGRRRVVSNSNSRPQPMKQPNNTFTGYRPQTMKQPNNTFTGYRPQTMNHPSNTFTNDDTPSRRLEL